MDVSKCDSAREQCVQSLTDEKEEGHVGRMESPVVLISQDDVHSLMACMQQIRQVRSLEDRT